MYEAAPATSPVALRARIRRGRVAHLEFPRRSHAVDASLRVRLARGGRDDVEVRGCVIEEAPGTV